MRLISPGFWANNEAQTHRLVPWLTRELRLLLRFLSPKLSGTERLNERVTAAVQHLLELIKRVEFRSPEFRAAVASVVGNARADHFIYEFENFARSPYHMGEYDARVQYPPAERQLPHAVVPSSPVSVSSSSSLSSSLSSLEIHDNISISSSVSIVGEEPCRSSTIDLDTDSDVEMQLAVGPATDATAVSAPSNLIAFTISTQPATIASRASSSFYSIDSDGVVSASAHHPASDSRPQPPASPTATNAFSKATTQRTDLSSSSVRNIFAAPSLLEELLLPSHESRSILTRRHQTHSHDSLDSDEELRSRRRHRHSAHLRLTRSDWSRSRSRSSSRSPDPHQHSNHNAESSTRPTRVSLFQQSTSSSSNHTSTTGIAERSREHSHRQQHNSSFARYRSSSLRPASASSLGSVEAISRSAARSQEATRDGERDRSRSRSPHRGRRHRSRRQRHVRAHSSSASRRSLSPRPRQLVRERSHDRSSHHHLQHLSLRRDWFW